MPNDPLHTLTIMFSGRQIQAIAQAMFYDGGGMLDLTRTAFRIFRQEKEVINPYLLLRATRKSADVHSCERDGGGWEWGKRAGEGKAGWCGCCSHTPG